MKFAKAISPVTLCLLCLPLGMLSGCSDTPPEVATGSHPLLTKDCSIPSYDAGGQPTADREETATPLAGGILMRQKVIRDPARGNMPALELLVPDGWSVEGGITQVTQSYGMLPYFSDVSIEAPDKRGVRFWGIFEFGYADNVNLAPFTPYMGRPFFPLQPDLGTWWKQMQRISPAPGVSDLEIVSEEQMPELTELVRQQLSQLYRSTEEENRQLRMRGEQKSFDVHARQLVLRYKDEGVSVEMTVFATVRHSIYSYSNGMIRAAMWNIDNMYAVFGPAGTDYLHDPVLAAIVRSRQYDMNWQAAIQEWYLRKNQQIVAEGQARIAAASRQAAQARVTQSDDVLDISFNGWKKRNAMKDAGHTASVLGIHEETRYATPSGTTVDLPSYYQNVYTDRLGNYILHNDANYNINTDPAFSSRDWQRINPVNP